jgi:hypothetical protein
MQSAYIQRRPLPVRIFGHACSIVVRRTTIERLQIFDAGYGGSSGVVFVLTDYDLNVFCADAVWHEA